MKIQEIITELKNSNSKGLQLKKRNGILTSTWLIYKKNEFYYYFDINQKLEFTDNYKYSEDEIYDELKNAKFDIEIAIS